MSLISCLGIAQEALSVSQSALTVVSNNIANVDNKSYSKLEVQLEDVATYTKSTSPYVIADALGGVAISQIKRYSNEYLENYYRSENSQYNYSKEYSTVGAQLQNVVNELNDGGISSTLATFYTDIAALSASPKDSAARQTVISDAENLCSLFNQYSSTLSTMQSSLVGDYHVNGDTVGSEISTECKSVNNLLDQIAAVNKSIVDTNSSGITSTALLDQRDSLLQTLSGYMNFDTKVNSNGSVNISVGNQSLVAGSTVKGYLNVNTGTADEPAVISVVDKSGNVLRSDLDSEITGGSMGAILDICGSTTSSDLTISSVISKLDNLASTFASSLNAIQNGPMVTTTSTTVTTTGTSTSTSYGTSTTYAMCLTPDGSALTLSTNNFFVNNQDITTTGTMGTTGITAATISVNSALVNNANNLAVGRVSSAVYTAGTYTNDISNNSNVTTLTNSRTAKQSTLGNQTFEGYLSSTVSNVGTDVAALKASTSTQSSVLTSISNQLQSETGVNLDDELGDLIKYQRAYEAAARIFSTTSSILEELINLGRS